jgi:hypothetical protein
VPPASAQENYSTQDFNKNRESPVAAKIIDGVAISRKMRDECRSRVAALKARSGLVPGLAVILVGDNPASAERAGRRPGRSLRGASRTG